MIRQTGTLLILGLTSLGIAPSLQAQDTGNAINRDSLRLVFEEKFDRPPDYYDPVENPDGRWKTNFAFGVQDPGSSLAWETRTLRPNHELQYYGDPAHDGSSYDWEKGSLTLVAQRNPLPSDTKGGSLPYMSGLITTEKSFAMRYGYFEARIAMPTGKGLWPAFWLLPPFRPGQSVQPQQEIDVVENIGARDEIHATVHTDEGGKKVPNGEKIAVSDVTRPHDYGVMVKPDRITWYIDGKAIRQAPNRDFDQPAYMLLDLAVGGKWPGAPDDKTHFPARMKIEWVRAYAIPGSTVVRPSQ
ncbi:glycoside hydrolase family 16 protein [Stakelama sp. CBK3Z-3]|uniref:Glycoside hydrolase family 16 protein n=1 Tax=Stakelama flava TaxID=2860338 RepID=A0ABS6XIA1_9SPHN|nr:glycoside hydrolase family 16 protein [Stakelama flava]MBW4329920.1 glycoside hydrolase family 16 protein [Stakelama flava]